MFSAAYNPVGRSALQPALFYSAEDRTDDRTTRRRGTRVASLSPATCGLSESSRKRSPACRCPTNHSAVAYGFSRRVPMPQRACPVARRTSCFDWHSGRAAGLNAFQLTPLAARFCTVPIESLLADAPRIP